MVDGGGGLWMLLDCGCGCKLRSLIHVLVHMSKICRGISTPHMVRGELQFHSTWQEAGTLPATTKLATWRPPTNTSTSGKAYFVVRVSFFSVISLHVYCNIILGKNKFPQRSIERIYRIRNPATATRTHSAMAHPEQNKKKYKEVDSQSPVNRTGLVNRTGKKGATHVFPTLLLKQMKEPDRTEPNAYPRSPEGSP